MLLVRRDTKMTSVSSVVRICDVFDLPVLSSVWRVFCENSNSIVNIHASVGEDERKCGFGDDKYG
jgi:hypothetical protein